MFPKLKTEDMNDLDAVACDLMFRTSRPEYWSVSKELEQAVECINAAIKKLGMEHEALLKELNKHG